MEPPPNAGRWHALSAAVILALIAARLGYISSPCPLDLAPDEAHYWDWSRRLDWAYYSKGPLVAWLIRASGELVGHSVFAVRLPAVLCGAMLLAAIHVLTCQTTRRPALAFAAVAFAATVPALNAGGVLMTIDAPFCACWAWALVVVHRAIFRPAAWAWPLAALLVALGLLAKFTMLLFVPAVLLFAFTQPNAPRRAALSWLTLGLALAALPILWWNARHGWAALRHVEGQAGFTADSSFHPFGPLRYAAEQGVAVLCVFWGLAWACAAWRYRPWADRDPHRAFLWWSSIPVWLVFAAFSLRSPGQLNWPVAAYLGGAVLAAIWLDDRIRHGLRRWWLGNLAVYAVIGSALSLVALHPRWAAPLLHRLAGPPTAARPMPLRRFDPLARLRGWPQLAAAVDQQRRPDLLLATTYWTVAGELAFYCADRPTVFCFGPAQGERLSQYDLWPSPVWQPEDFLGRDFLIVGEMTDTVRNGFTEVGAPVTFTYAEGEQPVLTIALTICRGFRGVALPATPRH